MAANFYTTPRMTRDIDLVVELSDTDIDRVVSLFQDEYYIDPDMVQQVIRNRSMFNMIHNALLDTNYLHRWADQLGLAALYREVCP